MSDWQTARDGKAMVLIFVLACIFAGGYTIGRFVSDDPTIADEAVEVPDVLREEKGLGVFHAIVYDVGKQTYVWLWAAPYCTSPSKELDEANAPPIIMGVWLRIADDVFIQPPDLDETIAPTIGMHPATGKRPH